MHTIVDWERDTSQWSAVVAAAQGCTSADIAYRSSLWPIYGPLVEAGQSFVIGQLGQSLDGRIATASGHSHYINGAAALTHLHRLRALVDAVVVGVGTVIADDPQLTVRHAALAPGKAQPARVVLDPRGRMSPTARCLAEDGARRIVIGAKQNTPKNIEHIQLMADDGGIASEDVLAALTARGLSRVLIEGGANTLSRFLKAGTLSRLHILTGPLIIGSGPVGINLPDIGRLENALRPEVRAFALPGGDVLFDCAFAPKAKP